MYDELYHYGVKGMKWGVRKDRGSSSGGETKLQKAIKYTHPVGYTVAKKVKNSKRYRQTVNKKRNLTGSRKSDALTKYRSKDINGMSNQDLQNAVNRMNLEKQYRSLTRVDIMRGKKAVDNMYATGQTVKTVKKVAKASAK